MANKQHSVEERAVKLEELRKLAYEHNFPIRKFMKVNSYLSRVYYQGSEKIKGGIIPITCSMSAIYDLEREINLWVEKKTLSEEN